MNREAAPTVTLGEIWEAWQRDRLFLRRSIGDRGNLPWKQRVLWDLLGKPYRDVLCRRPDYQLRLLFLKNPLTYWCELDALMSLPQSMETTAAKALASEHSVVKWGALAVVCWAATGNLSLKESTAADWYEMAFESTGGQLTDRQRNLIRQHAAGCPRCVSEQDAVQHLVALYNDWLQRYRTTLLQLAQRGRAMLDSGNLCPLPDGEQGCGIISAMLTSGIAKLQFEVDPGYRSDVATAKAVLDSLATDLAPLGWRPGRTLDLRTWEAEHSKKPVLLWPKYQVCYRLCNAFFRARGSVHHALIGQRWTPTIEALLHTAYYFSREAYHLAKALRISLQRRILADHTFVTPISMSTIRFNELHMLRRLSQATRDAGGELEAAATACYLLQVIPKELLASSRHKASLKRLATDVGHGIRQAGYCFDTREGLFHGSNTSAFATTGFCAPPDESIAQDTDQSPPRDAGAPDPYRLRLMFDRTENTEPTWPSYPATATRDDWRNVHQHFGHWNGREVDDPLGLCVYRAEDCDDRQRADVLPAAYRLCIRYSRLADAAKLLIHFSRPPTRQEVLDFAHLMKRALQVMPFGIDVDCFDQWRNVLRANVARLDSDGWSLLSNQPDDLLAIHESLRGRCLSIVRHNPRAARLLTRKLYGGMNDTEVREAIDTEPWCLQHGPGIVSFETLTRCLQDMDTGSLGYPVLVSCVSLGDDRYSILSTGRQGKVQVPGLDSPVRWPYLALHAKRLADADGLPEIDRMGSVRFLVEAVLRSALKVHPYCRWLILAIEPELAALPWQRLVRAFCPGSKLVVSIVPSCTWVELAQRPRPSLSTEPRVLISDLDKLLDPIRSESADTLRIAEQDYGSLRDRVTADELRMRSLGVAWSIVLGHGVPMVGDRFTSIEAPDAPIDLDTWIELSTRRLLVLHACWGGQVGEHLLGDLSGVPGIALGVAARAVLAPGTQVTPTTAAKLQETLLSDSGRDELGARYLRAIQEDENVARYNLYGLANERVA
jgi:hypothetical protein